MAAEVPRSGAHALSKSQYARDVFPRYIKRPNYLLSRDVLESIIHVFPLIPYFLPEDAFIGEAVFSTGLDITHSDLFRDNIKGCRYNVGYITIRPVNSSSCMEQMHKLAELT